MVDEITSLKLLLGIIVFLVGVVGELLRRKDNKQQAEMTAMQTQHRVEMTTMQAQYQADIAKLWEKHDEDATRLQELEVSIAKDHYVKSELDNRLQELKGAFNDGLRELGNRMDKSFEQILKHILEKK